MCTSTSTQRRTAQRLLVLEDLKLRSAAQHKQLLELKYKCKLKHNYTKRNRWINILGCSSLRTKLEKNKKDVEQHWFVTFSQLHQHLYTDHCDWQINYLYFRPFKIIWFVTYIKKLPGLMRDYKRPQHTNWQCYCHNPCLISPQINYDCILQVGVSWAITASNCFLDTSGGKPLTSVKNISLIIGVHDRAVTTDKLRWKHCQRHNGPKGWVFSQK